jgi:thioredoxin 1
MAIELNRDNYDSEVIQSQVPVLVDFWGSRCGPCLALMPTVEEIEAEYGASIKVAKVNAAENRMLCARLRVLGLPTFLLYRGGSEVKRLGGEQITRNDLILAVDSVLD